MMPQNLYTVSWWEMDGHRVARWDATYYKDMPWARYAPDDPGGADIRDTWMLRENGRPRCRVHGWARLQEMLDDDSAGVYETELDALTASRVVLMRRKTEIEDELERVLGLLQANKERIQKKS